MADLDGLVRDAVPDDANRRQDAWRALLGNAGLRNAIALQSPSFCQALARGDVENSAIDHSPVALPLFRYASRSALRCTPRGLFAATGLGRIGAGSAFEFGDAEHLRVVADLSLDYLSALLEQELRDVKLAADTRFLVNPTLSQFGDTITLQESVGQGAQRTTRRMILTVSGHLQPILNAFGPAGLTREELRECLARRGVATANLSAQWNELVATQILLPRLGVSTTADDPVHHLIQQFPAAGRLGVFRQTLSSVRLQLQNLNHTPTTFSLPRMAALCKTLPEVPGLEAVNHMLQIETFCDSQQVSLGLKAAARLARAIERLHFLFGDYRAGSMASFSQAFLDRFGEATVPLQRVLDLEQGIGIPLINNAESRWHARGRRSAMLRLMHRALEKRLMAVELEDDFWSAIADADLAELPSMFSAVCSLVAGSETEVDRRQGEIFLDCVVGNDGTELWARHARLHPGFHAALRGIRRMDCLDTTGAVHADIAFTPIRGANVAWRAGMAKFQINCSVTAASDGVDQLSLDDLFVQIRNARVRLLSRRLAKEVIPIIGSAFAPDNADLPAYAFLRSLARQDKATPLQWDWGELSDSPFLPRVSYRGVVFAPARWCIVRADIQAGASMSAWRAWRIAKRIPDWVAIGHDDDRSGCNVDHWTGLALIQKELNRTGYVILEELRVDANDLCASLGARKHAHELIVPFMRGQADGHAMANPDRVSSEPSVWFQKFAGGVQLPGAEWIYAKLYASPRQIQSVIHDRLPGLVARLRAECQLGEWFFFRYKDTDWHLRLRFRIKEHRSQANAMALINELSHSLLANERIWRLQYDTYYREIERFGGHEACALVESIFSAESDLVLCAEGNFGHDQDRADLALSLAAGLAIWYWRCLGLDSGEIAGLAHRLLIAADKDHRAVFSSERGKPAKRCAPAVFASLASPWAGFAEAMRGPLKQLQSLARNGELSVRLHDLAGDLVHLMINRFFDGDHEQHERNLYRSMLRSIHIDRANKKNVSR